MADGTCTVEDCDGRTFARGWCNKHWKRWRKHGDVHDVGDGRTLPAIDRFLAKVEWSDILGCWTWTGGGDGYGYGVFKDVGQSSKAHRYSYELFVGSIPAGLEIDHLCRNRACVNPIHLEPVTSRENVLRGTAPSASNATKTHCPKGHPYDEANTCHSGSRRERVCRACRRDRQRRRTLQLQELVQK